MEVALRRGRVATLTLVEELPRSPVTKFTSRIHAAPRFRKAGYK